MLIACASVLLYALRKLAPGKAEKRGGRISSVSTCEKPASETRAEAASASVKTSCLACSFLLALEIGNDQAPAWFEHPRNFHKSLPFEARRQMMHHQGREHHIERLVGKGELLDYPDLELDGQMAPRRFRAGTGDLLRAWVDANHAARAACAALDVDRQSSCTAADIQHLLSTLKAGEGDCLLPQLAHLASE